MRMGCQKILLKKAQIKFQKRKRENKMRKYLDKIIHLNATPEFVNNPKCMRALEKMVELAYKQKMKSKKKPDKISEKYARSSCCNSFLINFNNNHTQCFVCGKLHKKNSITVI